MGHRRVNVRGRFLFSCHQFLEKTQLEFQMLITKDLRYYGGTRLACFLLHKKSKQAKIAKFLIFNLDFSCPPITLNLQLEFVPRVVQKER